jgi:hypothetical protein
MLQVYGSNVSKVCCKCFIWILYMLQWLYTYVTSVYSKCFICFFKRKLQVCLSGCCIYFTHMLQVFYLDVTYACNGFQVFFMCFCKYFKRMLQVFQLLRMYIVNISFGCCKNRSNIAHVASRNRIHLS